MIETELSPPDTTSLENRLMRSRRIALSLFTAAAIIAIPLTVLAADTTGAEGRARSVDVVSPSADTFLQYHGRLFVATATSLDEYRWGGTSCGSRTMSEEQVKLLTDATNSAVVRVTPIFQDGQGAAKCLVGFTLRNKDVKDPT
jgi:hypothetical protein